MSTACFENTFISSLSTSLSFGDSGSSKLPLSEQDLSALQRLNVPVPTCECERIGLLRESHLLDSEVNEGDYARYTNLAARIFKVRL